MADRTGQRPYAEESKDAVGRRWRCFWVQPAVSEATSSKAWRAMASSSLVGTTMMVTGDPSVEMIRASCDDVCVALGVHGDAQHRQIGQRPPPAAGRCSRRRRR